jgi:hypothetical protein
VTILFLRLCLVKLDAVVTKTEQDYFTIEHPFAVVAMLNVFARNFIGNPDTLKNMVGSRKDA